jgi:hypothetical protein
MHRPQRLFQMAVCSSFNVRPSELHCSCKAQPLNAVDVSSDAACASNTSTQGDTSSTAAARKRASRDILTTFTAAEVEHFSETRCSPVAASHTMTPPSQVPAAIRVPSLDHSKQQQAAAPSCFVSVETTSPVDVFHTRTLLLFDVVATRAEFGLTTAIVIEVGWSG